MLVKSAAIKINRLVLARAVPHTDMRTIKAAFRKEWQIYWLFHKHQRKFREIKPEIEV